MKGSGETNLLLILAAIVILGGGAMVGLNVMQGANPFSGQATPQPTPTPFAWTDTTFQKIAEGTANVHNGKNAKMTIVEFADVECPSCRRAYGSVLKNLKTNPSIKFVFRHFPLESMHPRAMPSALALEAAARQGKFWPMYDALFAEEKTELTDEYIADKAKEAGLNVEQFKKDLTDNSLRQRVESDTKLAEEFQVISTPTFVIRDPDGKFHQAIGGPELQSKLKQLGF